MRRFLYLLGVLLLVTGGLVKLDMLQLGWPPRFALSAAVRAEAVEVAFIGPEALKKRLDQGEDVLVADVRRRASYDKLHLEGAVSRPMDDHAIWGPELAKDQLVVLYCACESDTSSADAARELRKRYGHDKVMVLEGGLGGWVDAGYPIVEKKIPAGLRKMKV